MARDRKEAAGWGFRLVALLLTVAVSVAVFAYAFSTTGNEPKSIMRAVIPVGSALLVSFALGSISKLSHKKWQIYTTVLLLVGLFMCLRVAGVF